MKTDNPIKNHCNYIGICGSCVLGNLNYEEQLAFKTKEHINNFSTLYNGDIEIFRSPVLGFRSRAEFKLYHQNGTLFYAMVDRDKKYLCIDMCMIVSKEIQTIMPKLLHILNSKEILGHRAFMVEFLSNENEMLVTIAYHKVLDDEWIKEAKAIEKELNIRLLGRSRGQKIVLSQDFITNTISTDEYSFKIIQKEGAFSQPNSFLNNHMISWIIKNIPKTKDLCELYCGGGNFTLPLSRYFDRVLATEISKTSIASAKQSCELNGITNIEFIRMSSEEFVEALEAKREFRRLKDVDLSKYSFYNKKKSSTIFVDPPRAGLDDGTLKLVGDFDNIAYISCNPTTLLKDLQTLCKTHKIIKFAFFDQFVWSPHIECGVILKNAKL